MIICCNKNCKKRFTCNKYIEEEKVPIGKTILGFKNEDGCKFYKDKEDQINIKLTEEDIELLKALNNKAIEERLKKFNN